MGKANRERRRAKQKKTREQRYGRAPGQGAREAFGFSPGQPPPSDTMLAADLIGTAVAGLHREDQAGVDSALARLASTEPAAWARTVDRSLFTALVRRVGAVWRRNWQPGETVRQVGRALDRAATDLCADLVVAENRGYAAAAVDPRWAEQVQDLGGEPWWGEDAGYLTSFAQRRGLSRLAAMEAALRLAAVLETLPPMQKLLPLPGEAQAAPAAASGSADPAKLAKIRSLLAKAESTEFPEEAEALTARAQEMMARHSIDAALLAAESGTKSATSGRRLPVDSPYEQHKTTLLNVIADANHCRAIWHKHLGLCTVVGFPGDVDAVELLFTSLLVQANTAMRLSGSTRDRAGRSTTRSFRASFLAAFAARIGERLVEAAHATEREAVEEYAAAGRDLVPVFAARRREVDGAVEEMFPDITYTRTRGPSNAEGWYAGRAAADAADLHAREQVRGC